MIYCANCGEENPDGAYLCERCGEPLEGHTLQAGSPELEKIRKEQNGSDLPEMEQYAQEQEAQQPIIHTAKDKKTNEKSGKKIFSKILFFVAGTAGIAVVLALVFYFLSAPAIPLNQFMYIDVDGYDGYGTVTASIDWSAIGKKCRGRLSFTRLAREEIPDIVKEKSPLELLEESVVIQLDAPEPLSNGDEISYTFSIADAAYRYLDCDLQYENGTYSVTELTKIGQFDAFSNLEVTFEGSDADGIAILYYSGQELSTGDYTADKTSGLRNGDVIRVSIREDCVEECLHLFGEIPEVMEKEYLVSGLPSYIAALEEIDDATLAAMQDKAEDVFRTYLKNNWPDSAALERFTYLGDYLLTAKRSSVVGNKNAVFLVYQAQVRNFLSGGGKSYDKVIDIFWFIKFHDLVLTSDGKVSFDLTSYNTPDDTFSVDSGISIGAGSSEKWKYFGYQTFEELYDNAVEIYFDSYRHEDNVKQRRIRNPVHSE